MKTKFEKNYFDELVEDYGQIEDVPSWAINYLINGDASDLSDEEISEIESWKKEMVAEGMQTIMILHTNGREYTDNADDPLATNFRNFPAFGGAADCVECVALTREFSERLSEYHKKMDYISENDFDAVVYNPAGMNYGGDTFRVYFANDYGYKIHDFLVEDVDSEEGALEEVSRYCHENGIADGCNIMSAEQFGELCEEEFGKYPDETDDAEFAERMDVMYFDPGMYFDMVHLGIEQVD